MELFSLVSPEEKLAIEKGILKGPFRAINDRGIARLTLNQIRLGISVDLYNLLDENGMTIVGLATLEAHHYELKLELHRFDPYHEIQINLFHQIKSEPFKTLVIPAQSGPYQRTYTESSLWSWKDLYDGKKMPIATVDDPSFLSKLQFEFTENEYSLKRAL